MSSRKHEEMLRQAIEAAREGKRAEAKRLIAQILDEDDENVKAWWWLSRITEDLDERRIALTTVVQLEPDNAKAQEALRKLEARNDEEGSEIAPGINRQLFVRLAAGTTALVVVIIIVVVMVINNQRASEQQAVADATNFVVQQTQTTVQLTAAAATETAVAFNLTETQIALVSPTPTLTNTRASQSTLPPTYTPTPTETPRVTPTPLPQPPAEAAGLLFAWGGPDLINDGYLPIITLPLNGGGQFRDISQPERGVHVAASDQFSMIYTRYFRDVFEESLEYVDLRTGENRLLAQSWENVTTQRIFRLSQPQLTADGRFLAFSAYDETLQYRHIYLYDINASGDPITLLTTDEANYEYPTLSADGSQVIASRRVENLLELTHDLFLINVQTKEMRPFTSDGPLNIETHPRYSPDGGIVAYAIAPQDNPDVHDIMIVAADGSGSTFNVTNHPADDIYPVFSPDNRYIAFSSNRAGAYNIYVYDTQSGSLFQLTSSQDDYFPGAWVN